MPLVGVVIALQANYLKHAYCAALLCAADCGIVA